MAEPFDQTITDAAAFFGVTRTTVRKWANQGVLPGMRTPGDRWRFRRSEMVRYAESRLNVTAPALAAPTPPVPASGRFYGGGEREGCAVLTHPPG